MKQLFEMTVNELKVLVYDEMVKINVAQKNINILEAEIVKKNSGIVEIPNVEKKDKEEK